MSDNKRSQEKVIIVGNSPSILLQEYGELIDSYDVVIRLNRCVTEGFEKNIGKKIDIWATARTDWYNTYAYVPENYKDIKYLWVRTRRSDPNGKDRDDTTPLKLPEDFPKKVRNECYVMYKHGSWFLNFQSFLKPYKLQHEPCTGLLTILAACRFYDDITVHGFTFGAHSDDEHRISCYYRESELESDVSGSLLTHPEDPLWYSKKNRRTIGTRSHAVKKREILKELIENGIPKKHKNDQYGFQEAHPPIKILNKEELEDMDI